MATRLTRKTVALGDGGSKRTEPGASYGDRRAMRARTGPVRPASGVSGRRGLDRTAAAPRHDQCATGGDGNSAVSAAAVMDVSVHRGYGRVGRPGPRRNRQPDPCGNCDTRTVRSGLPGSDHCDGAAGGKERAAQGAQVAMLTNRLCCGSVASPVCPARISCPSWHLCGGRRHASGTSTRDASARALP